MFFPISREKMDSIPELFQMKIRNIGRASHQNRKNSVFQTLYVTFLNLKKFCHFLCVDFLKIHFFPFRTEEHFYLKYYHFLQLLKMLKPDLQYELINFLPVLS